MGRVGYTCGRYERDTFFWQKIEGLGQQDHFWKNRKRGAMALKSVYKTNRNRDTADKFKALVHGPVLKNRGA